MKNSEHNFDSNGMLDGELDTDGQYFEVKFGVALCGEEYGVDGFEIWAIDGKDRFEAEIIIAGDEDWTDETRVALLNEVYPRGVERVEKVEPSFYDYSAICGPR